MVRAEDFAVGWICAITTEYVAAQAFLDEEYDEQLYFPNNKNDYVLGKIGKHNVVMSVLPIGEYGTSSASRVAEAMMHNFPNLRIALMVGLAGGAPSSKHDIRLGDIVVSSPTGSTGGVFQYDYGKTIQGRNFEATGFLAPSPHIFRSAVSGLKAKYELHGHGLEESISKALQKRPRLRKGYKRPDPISDRLYRSDIVHTDSKAPCDANCGNDPSLFIPREPRSEDEDNPAIHYGLIASANQLMKDAKIRDKFAAQKEVLCFEMEAGGLMNHFPCLVIRGICDYADSHKNKDWQGYAAMTAAAYAKDILYRIPAQQVDEETKVATAVKQADQHNYFHFGNNNRGFQVGMNTGSINGTSFGG